jgi:hypothetical protein
LRFAYVVAADGLILGGGQGCSPCSTNHPAGVNAKPGATEISKVMPTRS